MFVRASTMGEALYAAALRAPAHCREVAARIVGGAERARVVEQDTICFRGERYTIQQHIRWMAKREEREHAQT